MTHAVEISAWLETALGLKIDPHSAISVSGGCINEALLFEEVEGSGTVFVKINRPDAIEMFEAEERGLELLRNADAIRVPEPFAIGITSGKAVFAMEGIAMSSSGGPGSQERMGEQLAKLHGTGSPNGKFGADFDNHIGATPQSNQWHDCWADFFVEKRLRFQLQLAAKNGKTFSNAESALSQIHRILSDHEISSSLIHGDLWGGNAAFDETGRPVLYDPASYFGDAEADIAFTKMFGGFGPGFYRSYRGQHPAPKNENLLHEIYNLYHILNHYNLFGGGYGSQAERILEKYGVR